MTKRPGVKRAWQAGMAIGLAIVACYGAAFAVAILAAFGVSVALNQHLWAGLIVSFMIIALIALARSWRRHRRIWPLALAAGGGMLIVWIMYGSYSRQIELVGFLLLSLASVWDWRLLTCASESKATH